MDAIYYISGTLMTFTLIGLLIATIFFLFKPHHLQKSKHINQPVTRSVITVVALSSIFLTMFGFGTVMAATEPASIKDARAAEKVAEQKTAQTLQENAQKDKAEQERRSQEELNKPVIKAETKTEVVPFESTERELNSLPKGQTKVATEGVDGERTITYDVTYVRGKETNRKEVRNEITKASVAKVTQIGTYIPYVAPPVTPRPAPSGCHSSYSGQCVPIASDVDCGGGSGNGPAYVYGTVNVIGPDVYDLDRDGNGLGCE